jgi:hypothetical protein
MSGSSFEQLGQITGLLMCNVPDAAPSVRISAAAWPSTA